MILPLQNFTTLLQNMSAGLQGSAVQVIDLSVGSVIRALLEASASVALWMQWLILQVLSMTRAATSVGADLDSWMADFSLVRLPGAPSRGNVVFGRYTTGLPTTIPLGATVRTVDGSQSFIVVEDQSNAAWDGLTGYLVAPDIATVTVMVQALTIGVVGNVVTAAVGLLGSAIPGIDYVVNATALSGGIDAESDAMLRKRFTLFVNSRSLATADAVGAAIQGLQQGLRYNVLNNMDRSGNFSPGNFCVIVDDGKGAIDDTLLAAVNSAVDLVRPIASTFSVSRPLLIVVSVEMSIMISTSSSAVSITAKIRQEILVWIQSLPMGSALAISKLEAIAHETDGGVLSVTATSINGTRQDIVAPSGAVFLASSINVTAA